MEKQTAAIYLAARYGRRKELLAYANQLREAGYTVTSSWLNGEHETSDGTSDSTLRALWAKQDLADLDRASTVIVFTEPPESSHSRGGRHVEFGYALGRELDVWVVGDIENIFYALKRDYCFPDWESLFATLTNTL